MASPALGNMRRTGINLDSHKGQIVSSEALQCIICLGMKMTGGEFQQHETFFRAFFLNENSDSSSLHLPCMRYTLSISAPGIFTNPLLLDFQNELDAGIKLDRMVVR